MTSSTELDERICAMRVAVINAALLRMGYLGMPQRITQLVKMGWRDSMIYSQIMREQPLFVRIKVWLIRTFWVLVRMRLVVAVSAVIFVAAYLGRGWINEFAVAGWEAIQQERPDSVVQPVPD